MTFYKLFNKIGKQLIRDTQTSNVVAVLDRDYLQELLAQKQATYEIPLTIKFGNGKQHMWLVRDEKKKQ